MSYLDLIYQHVDQNYFLASNLQGQIASVSDETKQKLYIEIKCFDLMLSNGILKPVIEFGEYKRTDIQMLSIEEIDYIKDRLSYEEHPFLVSRYSHILHSKTKNNLYAIAAINGYLKLANQYLGQLKTKAKNIIDFIEVVEAIINLSLIVKVNIDSCKDQVIQWYNEPLQEQFYYKSLIDLFAESRLFRNKDLSGFTKSALDHFNANKCGFEAEDYLESCIKIAKKEQVDFLNIYVLMAENQLKLADKRGSDETGIVRANCYLKAAHYYKVSKNLKKSNEILRKLNAHKKDIKLGSVSSTLSNKDVQDYFGAIKLLAKYFVAEFPNTVFIGLAIDKRLLPNITEYRRNPEHAFMNFCTVSTYDINGNTHIINDLEKDKRDLFIYFKIGIESTLPFLFNQIFIEMKEQKRDFAKEGMTYFEGTWFKSELQQTIISEGTKSYNWMQSIKPALEILLTINIDKQTILLNSEQQMAFDQLAIKFEGLLRDLCQLANLTVNKVRESQTVAMDVNDILQNNELEDIFEKTDIEFWQFSFTGCGYNIRNNVAHAFYRPHDYTTKLANVLLIAYVRLAKYGNVFNTATENQV